ncbi:efflux RND transporter permease subunit [Allosphingosinicella deserti]|uniref:Multidrug transporter AcrB n=1 Tax=Allosphingosinicella deserti TaxID=2116704 RepID=A0A2P7QK95_9SPHN|nr:efflux RND transporter permease subunit [Sphingomonas deserti]PSJ38425.1 multidrug transporter AcrB [Sphingomonas deserti]
MTEHHGVAGISSWAIRNPIPVIVLFVGLSIAGIAAYLFLPVKQFPDVSFPVVQVSVIQEGAAPQELETQVTRLIEDAVTSVSGVDNVTSTITQSTSLTTIEFEVGDDPQRATDDVQRAIDEIRSELPREIEEPIVRRLEIDAAPILTYAVSAKGMSETELSWFVEDTIARELMARPGVAQVARVGGVDREINVVLDPGRMSAYGATAAQINEALRVSLVDTGGGQARVGGQQQNIRVLGAAESIDQIRRVEIPVAGRVVLLGDVASIGAGAGEEQGFARLDDRPVIAFQVMKSPAASDVAVEDQVLAALDRLRAAHPGVTIDLIVSTVTETRESFTATVHVLVEGMVLAALIVFLFLREWRSTVIAALAMPLSLLPTFVAMWLCGFTLNVVTLLSLTLVIGILVDDAIVEIENIEKRIERGQSPYQAALEGADAIGLAVIATTMAIVVVFTPVSFLGGTVGQFFKEFGLTVAAAVLCSLLVARLLTPLLAAYFLKPSRKAHEERPMRPFYARSLGWALNHHKFSVLLGGLFFAGSIMLAGLIPAGFMPPSNPGYIFLEAQAAPGATQADMERIVEATTRLMRSNPAVARVFSQTGASTNAASGADLRRATITVILKEDADVTTEAFQTQIRPSLRRIPDARVVTQGEWGRPDLEIVLSGENGPLLERTLLQLEREMRGIPQVADPRPATPPPGPELVIRPRLAEAARLGVSAQTIASAARVATIGEMDANVAMFTEGERRLPIRVRIPLEARQQLGTIEAMQVPTASGGTTTLGAVADIGFQPGLGRIDRFNRERRAAVQADIPLGITLGQATDAVDKLPVLQNLPPGVSITPTGDVEQMQELFLGFGAAMAAGVFMILAVMILLFRSFLKPLIILSALPLSIGGAFLALLLVGLDLTLPVLIGILMLMGLAAKNSILLVEFAIEREREGASRRDAIVHACHERARPIIMTTFAMAAGMLPTAIGLGEGSAFRQPMAVAVIGGLISSTALSLVLVPVVYEVIDRLEQRIAPKLRRFITEPEARSA